VLVALQYCLVDPDMIRNSSYEWYGTVSKAAVRAGQQMSVSQQRRKLFSLRPRPEWGPPNLLFSSYERIILRRINRKQREAELSLRIFPLSRIRGDLTLRSVNILDLSVQL
jgi:hypothetical protein